jgi:hypothetical protein
MFFTQFVPSFPVVHAPTFVFKDWTHPLLLNAIALGSLFMGKNDYVAKVTFPTRSEIKLLTFQGRNLVATRSHRSCNLGEDV